MNIREILFNIQQELKSSKNLFNEFAKFNYRNLEGILADLKPILAKYNCTITFNDKIVNVGAFNYIESTATLTNTEGETISVTSFAREDENKAGMSAGQMTGCSSSYSRKYALCGLCAINEEKDLDSMDNTPKQAKNSPAEPSKDNLPILKDFCAEKKTEEGVNLDELLRFYNYYEKKVNEFNFFNPEKQFTKWMEKFWGKK